MKVKNNAKVCLSIIILFCCIPFLALAQTTLMPLKALIHVASTVSDGKYTLEEIAHIAQDAGISVIVFTDRDLMKWEYGMRPARNLFKRTVEHNSILRYGAKKYVERIKKLQRTYPKLVFISGVESAPYYRWEGSPLRGNLKMYDWHKHILALGAMTPSVYERLPVIGNKKGLKEYLDVLLFWPFFTLWLGVVLLRKRTYSYKDREGKELAPYSLPCRLIGVVAILVSLLFLINNFPFKKSLFDQYQTVPKVNPYQNYIDYCNDKGLLTFWAHPESSYVLRMEGIDFITKEHVKDLFNTHDYTGFSVFYEGYEKLGKPGGLWDELLKEYCSGKREKPIWAIGGLAFDNQGNLKKTMADLSTVILARSLEARSVLDSMRRGKMYVVKGKEGKNILLDVFCLKDSPQGAKAYTGETFFLSQDTVRIKIQALYTKGRLPVVIKVIKNGTIAEVIKENMPFSIEHTEEITQDGLTYIRLEIIGRDLHVITNPIFIDRVKRRG